MSNVTGIAVDLGGTKIAVARFINGNVVNSKQLATDGAAGSESQINTIIQLLHDMQLGASDNVGVAVSGRVDRLGQWHAVNTDTLAGIEKIPLKKILEQRLNHPVTVMNDAVAGALGEATFGEGIGISAFAYVTVSTGVGGVCVLDGKPVVTDDGLAGHVGFMTSRNAVDKCGSGRIGTVESIASGRAMEMLARSRFAKRYSAKDIMEFHRNGHAWATQIVQGSAKSIAELGTNLAAAVGISRIVLGGGVGLSDGYDKLVRVFVNEEPELFRIDVVTAELESQSVLVGALVGLHLFGLSGHPGAG